MKRLLRRLPRHVFWALVAGFALLLLARLLAPSIVRWQVNLRLADLDGYSGHVDAIDLELWRGAYQLEGLFLERVTDARRTPFLEAGTIDFSLRWGALIRGRIESEIVASGVALIYERTERPEKTAELDDARWQDLVVDLFPIRIDRLELKDSRVVYKNPDASPPVDLSLEALEIIATGLTNRPRPSGNQGEESLPAHVEATGTTVGGGSVRFSGNVDPLADDPLFDFDLAVEDVELEALNDYLRAVNEVDVSQGRLGLYVEMTARDGGFDGYVKPLFTDVAFKEYASENDESFGDALWEGFFSVIYELFENQPRDQVGARVPVSGEFGKSEVGLWSALGSLFQNAFIEALRASLEGEPIDDEDSGSSG